MAVTLVGEVVNTCDNTTGFSAGSISGDDDFVQGTGALGAKVSNTYTAFYTTSLGATAPYDFSIGGTEEGWHGIMYFGSKSPLDPTAGQRWIIGNGTSRGEYYVPLTGQNEPKVSIFTSRVINFGEAFDNIAAGSWTTGGNVGQLTNITQMGGGLQTTVSIMGSFNNAQVDQITTGLGVRVDGGTTGTPNTFETVRAQDEDTSKWGWWSSVVGAIVGKGKCYIGPETGTATSVFTDTAFKVIFADERVATGFYEIAARGTGTDIEWNLGNISSANSASVRWSLTIDSTTNSFSDTNGTWADADIITLNTNSVLTGTTIINSNSLSLNSGTLDSVTFLNGSGTTMVTTDSLTNLTDCLFESTGTGHAIDLGIISTTQSMAWSNTDSGYASIDGSSGNETITVAPATGVTLTINVDAGYSTPTINDTGAGTVTVVSGQVTTLITVRDIETGLVIPNATVYLIADAGGPLTVGTEIFKTLTNGSGQVTETRSLASNQPVSGWVRKQTTAPYYIESKILSEISSGSGLTLTLQMISDE